MIWVVVCFYNMFWFFFQVGGPNVIVTLSCVCVIALIIYLDFLSISAFSVGKTVKPLIIRSWIGPRGPVLTVIWSNCHAQFPCILFKFQKKRSYYEKFPCVPKIDQESPSSVQPFLDGVLGQTVVIAIVRLDTKHAN